MVFSSRKEVAAALRLFILLIFGVASGETGSSRAMTMELDPRFFGCGRTDLNSSYEYGLINKDMHEGMSIQFTGNAEYDFLAGMIPHHTAAVDMCNVWGNASAASSTTPNEGIQSLCYNITYGPIAWGADQYDFSQPGENAQMLAVIEVLKMMEHYEEGCSALSDKERREIEKKSHHGMFMGCGRLGLSSTKEYIAVNMDMHMRMALNFTGDPDVDFLLGMIPHHEGAIDMCDIYYRYWGCAPLKSVCDEPSPLVGLENRLSDSEEECLRMDVILSVDHMCNEHIMITQPPEVDWMKEELRRIKPEALEAYETMQSTSDYPCGSQHGSHNGGMHGEMDMGDSNGGHTVTNGGDHKGDSDEHLNMTMGDKSKNGDGGSGKHQNMTMEDKPKEDEGDSVMGGTPKNGEEVRSGAFPRFSLSLPHFHLLVYFSPLIFAVVQW